MVATRLGTVIGKKIAKGIDKAMDKKKSSDNASAQTSKTQLATKNEPPKRPTLQTKTATKNEPPKRNSDRPMLKVDKGGNKYGPVPPNQGSSAKERRMLDNATGSKDTPPQRRTTSEYPAPPKRPTLQTKK